MKHDLNSWETRLVLEALATLDQLDFHYGGRRHEGRREHLRQVCHDLEFLDSRRERI